MKRRTNPTLVSICLIVGLCGIAWAVETHNLDMGSHKIVNVSTPTASGDAATKGYVDTAATAGGYSTSVASTYLTITSPAAGGTYAIDMGTTQKTRLDTVPAKAGLDGPYICAASSSGYTGCRVLGTLGDVTFTDPGALGTYTTALTTSGMATAGTYATPSSVTLDTKGRVNSITAGSGSGATATWLEQQLAWCANSSRANIADNNISFAVDEFTSTTTGPFTWSGSPSATASTIGGVVTLPGAAAFIRAQNLGVKTTGAGGWCFAVRFAHGVGYGGSASCLTGIDDAGSNMVRVGTQGGAGGCASSGGACTNYQLRVGNGSNEFFSSTKAVVTGMRTCRVAYHAANGHLIWGCDNGTGTFETDLDNTPTLLTAATYEKAASNTDSSSTCTLDKYLLVTDMQP